MVDQEFLLISMIILWPACPFRKPVTKLKGGKKSILMEVSSTIRRGLRAANLTGRVARKKLHHKKNMRTAVKINGNVFNARTNISIFYF